MPELSTLTDSIADQIAARIIERVSESLTSIVHATESEKPGQSVSDDGSDPILGLEYIRKTEFEPPMSKTAFYGSGGQPGFVAKLPVIKVSLRKRGVRRSVLRAVLDGSVRSSS